MWCNASHLVDYPNSAKPEDTCHVTLDPASPSKESWNHSLERTGKEECSAKCTDPEAPHIYCVTCEGYEIIMVLLKRQTYLEVQNLLRKLDKHNHKFSKKEIVQSKKGKIIWS